MDDKIPSFELSEISEAMKYLEGNGYVVIRNILSEEEIHHGKSLFWDFLETIPERCGTNEEYARRNDITSWTDRNWPGDPRTGIISSYGAGQSPFSWFLRTRPKVRQVFSKLWGTDDLLVSFDGFNAFRPWSHNPRWRTQGGWFHVDQNPMVKPGKECIQGLLTLYDVTPATGGLTVIPRSNVTFANLSNTLEIRHTHDFVALPSEHPSIQNSLLIQCKAGDLCLWDSRTAHCNTPGFECKENGDSLDKSQSDELLRLVSYICMTPRSKVKDRRVLKMRENAVKNQQSTSHWPHEFRPSSVTSPPFISGNPYIDQSLVTGNQSCVLM
mmetsp:Transcript_19863/g.25688  ORF Transcript_19863/g.25688 Transcript_19863/m.25688 type:complete len:327 (+) Transcript_19863:93-1073(+)